MNILNRVVGYLDLNSDLKRGLQPHEVAKTSKGTRARALPQWIALLLGIFIQPPLAEFRKTGQWNFGGSWSWLLFSVIVAVAIFPSVYRAAFDDSKPWLVNIAPIFTAGLGWEALFGAVAKAAQLAAH